MQGTVYHLNKADIRKAEIINTDISETLAAGEILLSIDKFALTAFFFAPDHALRRRKDWVQQKIGAELMDWAKKGMDWLQIEPTCGIQNAARVFADIRDGKVNPKIGHVISLTT